MLEGPSEPNVVCCDSTHTSYDATGNQKIEQPAVGNRTTTTWNYENQPTQYRLPTGSPVTMTYNSDNRRVTSQQSTTTTKFVWDRPTDAYLTELNAANAVQAVYTNEPQPYGSVISQRRGTTSHTLHADALGTIRLLATSAQASSDTYLYDAWGNLITSSGTTVNPFRWVGRYGYYMDSSTGLVYVRARMYQPSAARWMSAFPQGLVLSRLGINNAAIVSIVTVQNVAFNKHDRPRRGLLMYLPAYAFALTATKQHCIVDLYCADLTAGVEHCGIEVTDANGTSYYHVVSPNAGVLGDDTCDVKDTGPNRINTPTGIGPWRLVDKWEDATGALCKCVHDTAALIRSKKLPYFPVPANKTSRDGQSCKTESTCNSNYTTHCIMNKCGISSTTSTGRLTPGWDHRMKKCHTWRRPSIFSMICGGECQCAEGGWSYIDTEWCGDAPIGDPPGGIFGQDPNVVVS